MLLAAAQTGDAVILLVSPFYVHSLLQADTSVETPLWTTALC